MTLHPTQGAGDPAVKPWHAGHFKTFAGLAATGIAMMGASRGVPGRLLYGGAATFASGLAGMGATAWRNTASALARRRSLDPERRPLLAERAEAPPAAVELLSAFEASDPPPGTSAVLRQLIEAAPAERREAFIHALRQEDPHPLSARLALLAGDDPVAACRAAFAFIHQGALSGALGFDAGATVESQVYGELLKGLPDRLSGVLSEAGAPLGRELAGEALALLGRHSAAHGFWLAAAPALARIGRGEGPLHRIVAAAPEAEREATLQSTVAWWVSIGQDGDGKLAALTGDDPQQAWNHALNFAGFLAMRPGGAPPGPNLGAFAAFERALQAMTASLAGTADPLTSRLAGDAAALVRQYALANAALPASATQVTTGVPGEARPASLLGALVEALPEAKRPLAAAMLAMSAHLIAGPLRALAGADASTAGEAYHVLTHQPVLAQILILFGTEMSEARIGHLQALAQAEGTLLQAVQDGPTAQRLALAAEARHLLIETLPPDDPAAVVRRAWLSHAPDLVRSEGPLHERVNGAPAAADGAARVAQIRGAFEAASR